MNCGGGKSKATSGYFLGKYMEGFQQHVCRTSCATAEVELHKLSVVRYLFFQ